MFSCCLRNDILLIHAGKESKAKIHPYRGTPLKETDTLHHHEQRGRLASGPRNISEAPLACEPARSRMDTLPVSKSMFFVSSRRYLVVPARTLTQKTHDYANTTWHLFIQFTSLTPTQRMPRAKLTKQCIILGCNNTKHHSAGSPQVQAVDSHGTHIPQHAVHSMLQRYMIHKRFHFQTYFQASKLHNLNNKLQTHLSSDPLLPELCRQAASGYSGGGPSLVAAPYAARMQLPNKVVILFFFFQRVVFCVLQESKRLNNDLPCCNKTIRLHAFSKHHI